MKKEAPDSLTLSELISCADFPRVRMSFRYLVTPITPAINFSWLTYGLRRLFVSSTKISYSASVTKGLATVES